MALFNLPTFADVYHYRYRADLDNDGVQRTLEFHFTPRDDTAPNTDGAWWLSIYDANGDAVVRGVKLSLGKDKLAPYHYLAGVPKAKIHVVDTTGKGLEPSSSDFGSRVVVQIEREDAA